MTNFQHDTSINAPKSVVWEWHAREGAFDRLAPPWEKMESISSPPDLSPGGRRVIKMKVGPLKMKWIAEHTDLIEGELFADRMIRGPFKRWEHTHRLIEEDGATIVRDEVSYDLPFGFLGRLFGSRYVRMMVTRMFTSRAISLTRDIMRHQSFSHLPRKKILISGASGLIGSQLMPFLDTGGHEIIQLVRRNPTNDFERYWDPQKGDLEPSLFDGIDAVIHLGGVGIGDKRWSKKRKAAILDSRRDSVTLLAETMASLVKKPEVFIVASAIGIYGNRGDENIDENSGNGEGFLTDTALVWESSADAARSAGIRTIHLRSGIVLTPQGGALGRMLFPFKMGAGGPIGSGKQWMSWISMDDHIAAVQHLMMTSECEGVYNLTAPNPVRQKTFAKTLGRVLRRPAFAPLPGFILRILFGELARPLLLEGQKVHPKRLLDAGFEFEHSNLEDALRDTLGKWKNQ